MQHSTDLAFICVRGAEARTGQTGPGVAAVGKGELSRMGSPLAATRRAQMSAAASHRTGLRALRRPRIGVLGRVADRQPLELRAERRNPWRVLTHDSEFRCRSEDRVAHELERWFAEGAVERRPTYRTFVRHGSKRLQAALMRFGGPQRWALELRVPLERHRPGPGLDSTMIEAKLRDLLRKHRPLRFPTGAWLARNALPPRRRARAVAQTGRGR